MTYRLKEIADKKGYSINYLSIMTDIDNTTLYKICKNKRDARISTLIKLANFLGCSIDDLVVIE